MQTLRLTALLAFGALAATAGLAGTAPAQVKRSTLPPLVVEALRIEKTNPQRALDLLVKIKQDRSLQVYWPAADAMTVECVGLEGDYPRARELALRYADKYPNDTQLARAFRVFPMMPKGSLEWWRAPSDLRGIARRHSDSMAAAYALGSLARFYSASGKPGKATAVLDEAARVPGLARIPNHDEWLRGHRIEVKAAAASAKQRRPRWPLSAALAPALAAALVLGVLLLVISRRRAARASRA